MKKKHCYKKGGSDIYQKSNYATFYVKLRQDFCILTAYYTKSYYSEKPLKAVNNTPAQGRSVTTLTGGGLQHPGFTDEHVALQAQLVK